MIFQIRSTDVAFAAFVLFLTNYLRKRASRGRLSLKGPKTWNIFGFSQFIIRSDDLQPTYDEWAKKFGNVFQIPRGLGARSVMLYDPAAVNHVLASLGGSIYQRPKFGRSFIAALLGKGIIWAEGDDHKRQRRILSPSFNHQSIRSLTDIFYDSAHKVVSAWESALENVKEKKAVIDVELWMNRTSLDTVGIAAFSYDFASLSGKESEVYNMFTSAGTRKRAPRWMIIIPILFRIFPILTKILPNPIRKRNEKMSAVMGKIGEELLAQARSDHEAANGTGYQSKDKSLIGTLIRSEMEDGSEANRMSREEIVAQMKTLIFAGYETSSIVMTWILLELSAHPGIQTRLRAELLERCGTEDISYDTLISSSPSSGLPYLDAVVKETLRLHAPVTENAQECVQDDVVPLSSPLTTPSGKVTNNILIPKGTIVVIPLLPLNKSKLIWGEDSLEFKPERWLDSESGVGPMAKEVQGYHHLLTFLDGPRTCLGRSFAIGEIKAVIATLVRQYTFEPRDGKGEKSEIKYEVQRSTLPRPKIVDEDPGVLPLLIGKYDA